MPHERFSVLIVEYHGISNGRLRFTSECVRLRSFAEIAICRRCNNTNFNYPRLVVPVVIKWDVQATGTTTGLHVEHCAVWALFPDAYRARPVNQLRCRNYIIIIEIDTRSGIGIASVHRFRVKLSSQFTSQISQKYQTDGTALANGI